MTIIVGIDPATTTGVAVFDSESGEWCADEMGWRYAADWVANAVYAGWLDGEQVVVGMELPFVNFKVSPQSAIKQGAIYGFLWSSLHYLLPEGADVHYLHFQVSEWRRLAQVGTSKEASKKNCHNLLKTYGLPSETKRGRPLLDAAEAVGIALAAGRRWYSTKVGAAATRKDSVFTERL